MSDVILLSVLSQALERMEHVDAVVSDPEYVYPLNQLHFSILLTVNLAIV
jgi:hypothetical protein